MARGGKREGAGRPKKSDEKQLIERLDSIIEQDEVIEILKKKIREGDQRAMTLYMNYRYGKPKETVAASHTFENFSIKDALRFRE